MRELELLQTIAERLVTVSKEATRDARWHTRMGGLIMQLSEALESFRHDAERPTSPDLSLVHYAFPEDGVILSMGGIPDIACPEPVPMQWCGDRKRVTCPKCLESIDKKDR